MATRKFSAFTAGSTNQVPTDVLVGLDLSLAANAQNTKWTLNNLFAVVTRNITDGALRFGGFAAPAVSGAGEGSIYFDSTSNTFKISQNAGAYANIGNVSTVGFTSTRVPIANGANTLTDDAGLTFNTTTNILSVGETTGGGVGLVGSNGNSNVLASQAPAATLLTYWPNAAPTAGQFLYAATVGAQVQLGYQTAPSGSGSANQIAVWGASNALTGSSALTFTSGVVSITGTTNPGVVITGSAATESGITVNQSVSGAAADAFHSFQTPSTTAVWRLTTAGFTPTGLIKANQLDTLGATGTVEMLWRLADASTRFVYGVNNVEAASINATSTLGLVLGVASTLTGRVRMYNSAGTTYSQISAGNAGSSLNFIWPVVNPTAGQVMSASAPSGSDVTLSWITPSSGSSLTSTQVGFGSGANALTGSADLTYVDSTGVFDLTKTLNSSVRYTVTNSNTGNAAQARFGASADTVGASLAAYSSTFTTSGLIIANTALLDLDSPVALIKAQTGGNLTIGLGNTSRVALTDNQLAVTTAPTTGAGFAVSAATVTTGSLVSFAASGTVAASNTKTCLAVSTSGANGTASQTTFGATISNTSTGTTNTNIALQLTASGAATSNTALNVTAGAIVQASNLAAAFVSGANGATNPTFRVNNSTASTVSGIEVQGTAALSAGSFGETFINAISSDTGCHIRLKPKGGAVVGVGNQIQLSPDSGYTTAQGVITSQNGYLLLKAENASTTTCWPNIVMLSSNGADTGVIELNYGGGDNTSKASTAASLLRVQNVSSGVASITLLSDNSNNVTVYNNFQLGSAKDVIMTRAAAATLRFGATDAAAPVAQTLSVQNVVAGTSNTAGVTTKIVGSLGTSLGTPGRLEFQTGAATATSGTTQQTAISRYIAGAVTVLNNNTAIPILNVTAASNTVASGFIRYTVEVFDGTDLQLESGLFIYTVINKGGAFSNNTITQAGASGVGVTSNFPVNKTTSGTLTCTFAISAANPAVITVNANSSLTPSSSYPRITFSVENLTQQAVAVQ